MKNPKISVIMSVKNGMPLLKESVESILGQTFKNFEFIIVDDASTDQTWKYLKSLKDERIKLTKNKKNLGVAKSLNVALQASIGDYAARMDSDDISLPIRFQKQIEFLETHKEYLLIGSQVQWVDEKNDPAEGFNVPQTDDEIRKKLIWRNQIHHATVMFRKSDIEKIGGYRAFLNGIEDYDLWFRIIRKGKVANLSERLVRRRVHPKAITQKNHIKTELLAIVVRAINIFSLI